MMDAHAGIDNLLSIETPRYAEQHFKVRFLLLRLPRPTYKRTNTLPIERRTRIPRTSALLVHTPK